MNLDDLESLSQKLSKASERGFNNPYESIEWPEQLEENQLCFSPERSSISETDLLPNLSEERLAQFSLLEATNFFSLNISGERELISGLSQRLYKKYPPVITDYIHHFLAEENNHMVWFGTFCEKYAGKVYPDKKMSFARDYADGEEELLFFAKIVIFEEIVDQYNIYESKNESLAPIVRKIHRQHHLDESRHLSFGRNICRYLHSTHKDGWDHEVREGISDYLKSYLLATWREYYNPAVYIDAGFENPYELVKESWDTHDQHREKISKRVVEFLYKEEIIRGEVSFV